VHVILLYNVHVKKADSHDGFHEFFILCRNVTAQPLS
jgi:hypothetical protein